MLYHWNWVCAFWPVADVSLPFSWMRLIFSLRARFLRSSRLCVLCLRQKSFDRLKRVPVSDKIRIGKLRFSVSTLSFNADDFTVDFLGTWHWHTCYTCSRTTKANLASVLVISIFIPDFLAKEWLPLYPLICLLGCFRVNSLTSFNVLSVFCCFAFRYVSCMLPKLLSTS